MESMAVRAIGNVKLALAIFVDVPPVLRHVDRRVRQFDVLNDVKVARESQPKPTDFAVVNFVFDDFINTIGQQQFFIP